MKKLSAWAKYNPWKARFIIIICHLLLCALAIYLGILLNDMDVRVSELLLYINILVFLVIAAIYPRSYYYRKAADFIIAACSFISVCYVANNYGTRITSSLFPLYGATSIDPSGGKPTAAEILASLSHRDKKTLTRTEKRILRKELRHQLKVYVKAKAAGDKEGSGKSLDIIMTIIGAIGIIGLLSLLACQIGCAGSETLAYIFFITGTVGVIIGAAFLIRSITREKQKKPAVSQ